MAPRKAFINMMTSLVEKSPDPKLLKTLTKIVEEWVTGKVRMGGRGEGMGVGGKEGRVG